MDTKKYKVIITPTAYKEINKIYDYITDDLYAENATKRLMNKVEPEVEQYIRENEKKYIRIKKVSYGRL